MDFAGRFKGRVVLLDKDFAGEMGRRGINYTVMKRENMIKSEKEMFYHRILSRGQKGRKAAETMFSQLEGYRLRFIRTITRRSLAVKIIS